MSDTESLREDGSTTVEPYLPPEIEHIIFTMAFDVLDDKANTALLLVAKRVYTWIRPLVYQILDQGLRPPRPNFSEEGCPPVEDIGRFVHHLLPGSLHGTQEESVRLLSFCPNAKSLAWWFCLNLKAIISQLNTMSDLRRFSGEFDDVPADDLHSPAFLRLTHLELIMHGQNIQLMRALPSFIQHSQLTHVRFYYVWLCGAHETIWEILTSCNNLRVLILTGPFDDLEDQNLSSDIVSWQNSDPRLVVLEYDLCHSRDWVRGLRGFYDAWAFAEQIVTARRNRYFKDGQFQRRAITAQFNWSENLNEKGMEWYAEERKKHLVYGSPPSSYFGTHKYLS